MQSDRKPELYVVPEQPYDREQNGPLYDDYRMDPSARALGFALICGLWTVLCFALIVGGYYFLLRGALS
jgi:hypothetical protein